MAKESAKEEARREKEMDRAAGREDASKVAKRTSTSHKKQLDKAELSRLRNRKFVKLLNNYLCV